MTRPEFDAAICRLSLLRGAPDDGDTHFSALQDLPSDVFDRAVTHALRTRSFFPVPAELRMDADVAARAARTVDLEPERVVKVTAETHIIRNPFGGKDITVTVDREWHDDCDRCRDLGVRSWWCGAATTRYPDMPLMHCGRRGEHGPHEWVDACDCVDWNPTIRRRKAAQQKSYATPPEKVRS